MHESLVYMYKIMRYAYVTDRSFFEPDMVVEMMKWE